jgi:hypothetical protein
MSVLLVKLGAEGDLWNKVKIFPPKVDPGTQRKLIGRDAIMSVYGEIAVIIGENKACPKVSGGSIGKVCLKSNTLVFYLIEGQEILSEEVNFRIVVQIIGNDGG